MPRASRERASRRDGCRCAAIESLDGEAGILPGRIGEGDRFFLLGESGFHQVRHSRGIDGSNIDGEGFESSALHGLLDFGIVTERERGNIAEQRENQRMQAHADNQIALAEHGEKLRGRKIRVEYGGAPGVLHIRADAGGYAEVVFGLALGGAGKERTGHGRDCPPGISQGRRRFPAPRTRDECRYLPIAEGDADERFRRDGGEFDVLPGGVETEGGVGGDGDAGGIDAEGFEQLLRWLIADGDYGGGIAGGFGECFAVFGKQRADADRIEHHRFVVERAEDGGGGVEADAPVIVGEERVWVEAPVIVEDSAAADEDEIGGADGFEHGEGVGPKDGFDVVGGCGFFGGG